MKTVGQLLVFCLVLSASPLLGQSAADEPAQALRTPGWNKGVFVGGSQSFANTPSAQTFVAGFRLGRVLSHELGSNALRGSFEVAFDAIPMNEFWIGGKAKYAGAI